MPFLLFPTALSWTVQFHNDNYMVTGVALFLLGWVQLSFHEIWIEWKKIGMALLNIFFGSALIWFVRGYALDILGILGFLVGVFITLSAVIWLIQKKIKWKQVFLGIVAIWMAYGMSSAVRTVCLVRDETRLKFCISSNESSSLLDESNIENTNLKYPWKRTNWLPSAIDGKMKSLIRTRASAFRPMAGSNLDSDVQFSSAVDVIKYIPRALEIGFFAPFPNQWFEQGKKVPNTMMRRISGLEMIFVYGSWLGALYAIWKWRKITGLWTILFFCSGMIIIYVLAVINVGTLHRFRFGFLMPIVGLGMLGWFELIKDHLTKSKMFSKRKV
jgi:hypothetical protein